MDILLTKEEMDEVYRSVFEEEIKNSKKLIEVSDLLNRGVAKAQAKKIIELLENIMFYNDEEDDDGYRSICYKDWKEIKESVD